MSGFTVQLPSDASLLEFPDNTSSDFKVNTLSWPQLKGKWDVGLTGLYYPNHNVIQNIVEPAEFWVSDQTKAVNFTTDNATDIVESFDPIEGSAFTLVNRRNRVIPSTAFKRYALSPNNYRSISKIQRNLTSWFKNYFALRLSDDPHDGIRHYYKLKLQLDDRGRVKMIINKHAKFKIRFGETLANMLGFDFNVTYEAGVYVSCRVWNPSWSTSSLYVYSPIVESTIVGDVNAPLLRVLPLNRAKTRGDGTHSEFIHTHYIPLQDKNCTIIRIAIYNEIGTIIKFSSGRVVVTLHFRPIIEGRNGISG